MKTSLALCFALALTVFAGDIDQSYINLLCSEEAVENVEIAKNLIRCVDEEIKSNLMDSIKKCNREGTLEGLMKEGCNINIMNNATAACLNRNVKLNGKTPEDVRQYFINCFFKMLG